MDWTAAIVGLASLLFGAIGMVALFSGRLTKTETRQDQADGAIEALRVDLKESTKELAGKLDVLLERRMSPREA